MAQDLNLKSRSLAISPPPSMIEVDEHATSSDDSSLLCSASITSSVTQWEWENGRRYHGYKAGSYPIPNDEQELDRIDLKHHVTLLLCDNHLHLAPLVNPQKILDIGTGTGIWPMQMADQYPDSLVIGTDLSPVQPTWVPDNVRFEIDDIEAPDWSWPDNYFDYVHSRYMCASISSWQRLVRKSFQHCKPGGFFEMQELDPRFRCDDGSIPEDSSLVYWNKLVCEAGEKYNRPIPLYDEHFARFERAGFVDVKQVLLKSPSNPWPKDKLLKEVGKFQLLAHLEGLEGVSTALLTRGLGWKHEEVKILMAKCRTELRSRSIHSYQITTVIVGRKPHTPQSRYLSGETAYDPAPLTPASSSFDTSQSVPSPAEEASKERPLLDSLKDLTPVIDIPQRPEDPKLENPGHIL